MTNSSNRSARSRPESDRPPSTAASNPGPPAPTPTSSRPPDITSSVISSLANGTGCRKLGEATKVPRVSRDVVSAAAARVGTVACQVRVGEGPPGQMVQRPRVREAVLLDPRPAPVLRGVDLGQQGHPDLDHDIEHKGFLWCHAQTVVVEALDRRA